MSVQKKQILAEVYNSLGTFICTWSSFGFDGFTKELNGGPSECVLHLEKRFDYAGADLIEGNEVELRISDKDTVALNGDMASRVVFRGYISLIQRKVAGQDESVSVTLQGYYTLLGTDILKNGSQTTLYSNSSSGLTTTSASQNSADVGLMVRAVLDRFRSECSTRVWYDANRVPNTGTTATYSFEQMTYREALDQLRKMAPAGTYYYISETGEVTFGQKPTTPTHKFVFGRHFNGVDVESSLEKVRNSLILWNGNAGVGQVYKHYEDADSIASYGRRTERSQDYGIDNSDAADLIGARFLAENKRPEVRVLCTILDNNGSDFGYDIESIQPGDTCSFYGFSQSFDFIFQDNMLISKVSYYLDRAEIEVEAVKSGLQDFQNKQGTEIARIQTGGLSIPETYT